MSDLLWYGGREGGKEQAVLFYGRSYLLPHTLTLSPFPSSSLEGGKEQAVLFYGHSYLLPHTLTPSHPHPLPLLLPRVQRVLISPGSHQPTRLGPSQNIPSTLASSPSLERNQAPWRLPASTVVWAALVSCPTASWPQRTSTPPQNRPSSSVLQPRMTRGEL